MNMRVCLTPPAPQRARGRSAPPAGTGSCQSRAPSGRACMCIQQGKRGWVARVTELVVAKAGRPGVGIAGTAQQCHCSSTAAGQTSWQTYFMTTDHKCRSSCPATWYSRQEPAACTPPVQLQQGNAVRLHAASSCIVLAPPVSGRQCHCRAGQTSRLTSAAAAGQCSLSAGAAGCPPPPQRSGQAPAAAWGRLPQGAPCGWRAQMCGRPAACGGT